jgi:hypothetical protein
MTVAEVCIKATLAADYLNHAPVEGRNVGSILRIAQVLDIDPAILMGLRPTFELESQRADAVANITAHLAVAMAHVTATPLDIDISQLTERLVEMIRKPPVNGKAKPPKTVRNQSPK